MNGGQVVTFQKHLKFVFFPQNIDLKQIVQQPPVLQKLTHPLAGHRIRPVLWSPTSFGHGFSPSYSLCAPECGTVGNS